ncbi:hypothetical protein WEH80_26750 [Actinomycetes bacterium KLBMP 9759]
MLVIDLAASIVICHSGKDHAAPTVKRTFGYHRRKRTGTAYEIAPLIGSRPATPPDRGDPHPARWPSSSGRARTVERVIDWAMGGKPEREGRRCENPECRQVLRITGPVWKLCGRCQYEARTRTSTAPASVTAG